MHTVSVSAILLAAAVSLSAAGTAAAAATASDPAAATGAPAAAQQEKRDTLKSRLSDKASDEQRVNDCKVPPERRGPKKRPTECAAAGSASASGGK